MTIIDYRLMIALRWSDLESLKVKDEPLKNHLKRLRKRHMRCICGVYDPASQGGPLVDEPFGNGIEGCRRFAERKNWVYGDDDEVTVIVCRKASSSLRRKPGEFATVIPESIVPVDEDGDDSCDSTVEHEEEGESSVPDDVDPLNSGRADWSPRFVKTEPSRREKRAAKNNEYIRNRVGELRTNLRKLRGLLNSGKAQRPDELRRSIASIEAAISRLLNQRSDTDTSNVGSRGSWHYPPPPNLDDHRRHRPGSGCGHACAYCRERNRSTGRSTCSGCDHAAWFFGKVDRWTSPLLAILEWDYKCANVFRWQQGGGVPPSLRVPQCRVYTDASGRSVYLCNSCEWESVGPFCINPCCRLFVIRSAQEPAVPGKGG